MNHSNTCIPLMLFINGLLLAQTPGSLAGVSVEQPVLGFAFDETPGAVRPIRGLAGMGVVADPLDFGGKLTRFVLSAPNAYGLGALDGDDRLQLFLFGQRKVSPSTIAPAPSSWDAAILSPGGSAALVFSRSSGEAAVYTGLPAFPRILGRLGLLNADGIPGRIAVSDDGSAILAAYAQGDAAYLLVLAPDGRTQVLPSPTSPSHLTFIAGSDDALVASDETRQVYLLRNVTRGAQLIPLGGPLDRLQGRLRVAYPAAGGRVFAVGEESRDIAVINMSDGTVSYLSCDCVTSQLALLNGESLYLLNGDFSRPLWLLDGNPRNTRLYFVPAYQPPGDPALSSVPSASDTSGLPSLRLDVPGTVRAGDQFQFTASVAAGQPADWTGLLRLDFAPDQNQAAGDGPQFSTGGRIVQFTVPAGDTQAHFPETSMYLQTGLSSGRIVLTPLFSSASGYSPSPDSTPISVSQTTPAIPKIQVFAVPGSTSDKLVFELVATGSTSGGSQVPRLLMVTVTGSVTVNCQSGACGNGVGSIPVTTQFANYLNAVGCTNGCPNASYALHVPVTIEGSLLNIQSGRVDFLENGNVMYSCGSTSTLGSWTCTISSTATSF